VYEVLLESRAERDLKKLPAEVFNRIVPILKAFVSKDG
jgi:mRNA interferase RelE/StbE